MKPIYKKILIEYFCGLISNNWYFYLRKWWKPSQFKKIGVATYFFDVLKLVRKQYLGKIFFLSHMILIWMFLLIKLSCLLYKVLETIAVPKTGRGNETYRLIYIITRILYRRKLFNFDVLNICLNIFPVKVLIF